MQWQRERAILYIYHVPLDCTIPLPEDVITFCLLFWDLLLRSVELLLSVSDCLVSAILTGLGGLRSETGRNSSSCRGRSMVKASSKLTYSPAHSFKSDSHMEQQGQDMPDI